ncbi:DegT/DnrJ/EryC1/StrS family aminotransferase [Geomonas oryzisoli]|uniref:DegT/DnrJ/EryC1/StrS family aminotransferase n=1 Tax=Geomonas oryzisoli TaxID=2847992 RepID=A0ABX8JD57_9BACT|nr:DegT/DnrJ/EryC1/StrS family aminotransferase [Geomonas oryzisoli]QWV95077.1 DegT/DnrJ/EryC1/StrS family aminotransferase [Geomonas oryzisoli]
MMDFIPVNEPLLDGNEKKYLAQCIDTGWVSSEGPFVRSLEEMFAARMGRRYGVAVSNGTVALEAAIAALELPQGSEVILPTFTIISCAAAVIRAGLVPVVVDADPATWNMNVDRIEEKITPRTSAIMAVHIYGLPVPMAPLLEIAERHGLKVIEDAAQAHGLCCQGRPCGSFGDISTFSFYPNKLVTTGEGGIILTDDPVLAERCRSLRNLCFQEGKRFLHEELGFNFRMSNLQAALGVAQLERLDEFASRKRRMGERYSALLSQMPGITLPVPATPHADNIYWVYGVVLDESIGFDAEEAMRRLSALGVGTRPFFWPMHEQPVLRRLGLFAGESYPVAERLARRGFYLPSGLALTDVQIERAAAALASVIGPQTGSASDVSGQVTA